jgi:serpin B
MLVSAASFSAAWRGGPLTRLERPQPFRVDARRTVPAAMLSAQGTYRLLRAPDFDLLEMPFAGEKYSFVVLLPDCNFDLARVMPDLKAGRLSAWLEDLDASQPRGVKVLLPAFEVAGPKMDLGRALANLGMAAAFCPAEADFSGLGGAKSLRLNAVAHEAYLRVDEKGALAAAATASVLVPRSPEDSVTVEVNRPFLFLIRDRASGAVLFLGRVKDPTRKP